MEVNKGCIKYHSGPKTVCLYTVTTSLHEKHQQITVARLPWDSAKRNFWCYLKQPFRGIIFLVVHVLGLYLISICNY
jgi:hypothetical protein